MKKLLVCLMALLFGISIAFAKSDPVVLLQSVSDQMLAALKKEQPNLKNDPAIVYRLVNRILLPHADVVAMSQMVLGREAWQNASPVEQKSFCNAFKDVVIRTYSSALNAYTDERIKFYPSREGYEDKDFVEISSEIVRSDGPPVPVNYRLAYKQSTWKLYDLNVEGVGLIQSFQAQISDELSQGKTIQEITQALKRKKNKSNSTED